jgi:hypothetical protein
MKYIAFILILLFTLPVLAKKETMKTYDFSDMSVNGDFVKPEMLQVKDKNSAKFSKMLKLKASFINKLEKTDKDSAIK